MPIYFKFLEKVDCVVSPVTHFCGSIKLLEHVSCSIQSN